jgi:rare lipoprotein A
MAARLLHTLQRWMHDARLALLVVVITVLAGCASVTRPARDGPAASPPPRLDATPDAEPRVEPLRIGGPNKPYEIDGRTYVPLTRDVPLREQGLASWYGRKFHGRPTASGEPYDMHAMTAAHPTMPLPSYARVRNPANGREVIVRVNDRGPFVRGRVIDLSYTAALKLGVLNGVAPVEVERLTHEVIRTGAWQREGTALARAPIAPPTNTQAMPSAASPVTATAAATAQRSTAPAPTTTDAAPPAPEGAVASPVASSTVEATGLPPADASDARIASRSVSAATVPSRGYWVQLGAFRQREGAESFQQRVAAELAWIAPLLAVFADSSMHRLQAGPYASRGDADSAAGRLRDTLKLVPLIVERR